ncbi:hypothetical protein ACFL5M_06735, partial [Candidatus Neomarinimicrobiota bacterium]
CPERSRRGVLLVPPKAGGYSNSPSIPLGRSGTCSSAASMISCPIHPDYPTGPKDSFGGSLRDESG